MNLTKKVCVSSLFATLFFISGCDVNNTPDETGEINSPMKLSNNAVSNMSNHHEGEDGGYDMTYKEAIRLLIGIVLGIGLLILSKKCQRKY